MNVSSCPRIDLVPRLVDEFFSLVVVSMELYMTFTINVSYIAMHAPPNQLL